MSSILRECRWRHCRREFTNDDQFKAHVISHLDMHDSIPVKDIPAYRRAAGYPGSTGSSQYNFDYLATQASRSQASQPLKEGFGPTTSNIFPVAPSRSSGTAISNEGISNNNTNSFGSLFGTQTPPLSPVAPSPSLSTQIRSVRSGNDGSHIQSQMPTDYMLNLTPSTTAGTPLSLSLSQQGFTQRAQDKGKPPLEPVDEMAERLFGEIVRSPTGSPPPTDKKSQDRNEDKGNESRIQSGNGHPNANQGGEDIDIDVENQDVDIGTPPRSVDLKRKRSVLFDEPVTPANKKKKTIPKTPYEPYSGSSSEDEDADGDGLGGAMTGGQGPGADTNVDIDVDADADGDEEEEMEGEENEEVVSDSSEPFILATQAPNMDLDIGSEMDGDGERSEDEDREEDGDGDGGGSVVVAEIDEAESDDEEQVATQLEGDPLQIEDVTTPSPGRSSYS